MAGITATGKYAKFKGFKWTKGNEDVPALALVVDDYSKQLHICEPGDADTDWALAACSHPTVCIHSATDPATEYIKMYHDATNAYIDCVGATALSILIGGTAELSLTSSAFSPGVTNSSALGTTALMWSDLFLASGGVINFNNGEITLTHSATGKLAVASTWSTAGATGRPFSVNLTTNVSLGSYANAFKANIDCSSVGGATGLLSAGNFEVTFPTTGIAGTTVGVEIELTYGTTCGALQKPAFFYLGTNGTARSDFDTYGDLFKLSNNVTAGSGNFLSADAQSLRVGTGSLSATHKYIVLSNSEHCLDLIGLDVTNDAKSLIMIGNYDTALANTTKPTDNTFGSSIHISHATNADSGVWLTASYEKISAITNAQSNNSFVTSMVRMDIQQAVAAAYGIQSHVKFTAGSAQDVSSEVIAVSAQIYGACAAGTGYHWGVKSDLRETNCPSGAGHGSACFFGVGTVSCSCGLYLEALASKTMYSGIYLHAAGNITNCIETNGETNMTNFIKAAAAAGYIAANTHAIDSHALQHIITVDIAGDTGYIPVFASVPS